MSVTTVAQYLDSLPEDRRNALSKVRSAIAKRIPRGYEETLEFGMISWIVPLSRFPSTYNGRPLMLAALGSQKSHMAVYLTGIYGDDGLRASFEAAYRATGKRFDVGKSCVRFKKLEDLPIEVVADAATKLSVDELILAHERSRSGSTPKKTTAKQTAASAKKTTAKKPPTAAKKTTPKKASSKKTASAKKTTAKKPAASAKKSAR